ncbi:DUF4300 family protein [Romboutsia lituseburensis]|uniref:DUF4300 family protein n=1 Tax=Romboutsia lituseburensis TaxID=1537 RepID=UPI00215A9516|nr:DUF4300 family protein [Romboutsia lituseburensis]MCR8745120.1 DUF4300 family protein [Romboutsia lituseburensis]
MKLKGYILTLICTTALLTGCSNKTDEVIIKDSEKKQIESMQSNYSKDYNLIYSNLIDEKTKDEFINKLYKSGINNKYIEQFESQLDFYNKVMEGMDGLEGEFKSIDKPQAEYDEVYAIHEWEKKEYLYQDFNCRLTAFELYRDYINSNGKHTDEPINLMFDLDSIKNNPLAQFSEEDTNKFINLYDAIKTKDTTDQSVHIDEIKKEWKKRNITFKDNKNVSMINAYLHDYDEKELFIGHSGILIDDNGELLFLEKYSFLVPYQVSKFKNKKELYSYLMDRLDVDKTGNVSKPIIMENGNTLKFE